jgi:HECT-like Ubiquitin-conjugating enzyme (E2)-binding
MAMTQVTALLCRFCSARLTVDGALKRALPLPSGRFDDVIDEMICFEGATAVPMTAREV